MKTEIIVQNEESCETSAQRAGDILKNGGIVAFPTDTVYGLGAVFSDAQAVRKIFAAKGRPESKPLSILVSDISQVSLLARDIPKEAEALMKRFWPGGLTLIFKKNEAANIPDEVTAGGSTIGIRMPDNELAVAIIRNAGLPLAAPSANLSGKRSSSRGTDVIEDLDGRVDMIIDAGECDRGISSTILDLSGDAPRILRQGEISAEELEKVSGINII